MSKKKDEKEGVITINGVAVFCVLIAIELVIGMNLMLIEQASVYGAVITAISLLFMGMATFGCVSSGKEVSKRG